MLIFQSLWNQISWLERHANQFYFNDKGEIIVKFEDTQF